ncbi:GatB/YqeY domain-containing protein [Bdellovibrionota bacterium FG-2]
MATIKETLSESMKAAMKGGPSQKDRLAFCRNLHAAVRKREIDDRTDLDDAGVLKIISTLVKQRQDSIDQFRQGGREDLVAKEEAELHFLQAFMPAQMSEAEVQQIVEWAVGEVKSTNPTLGPKDMGNVMKLVVPKIQGRADGKLVNQLVRDRIAKG